MANSKNAVMQNHYYYQCNLGNPSCVKLTLLFLQWRMHVIEKNIIGILAIMACMGPGLTFTNSSMLEHALV